MPAAPPAKSSVLANVVAKTISVTILLGLSLVVFAYRRSLTPLYGPVPTDLHLNKIAWAACIVGSFAPAIPIGSATLIAGILLCLMPNTAYWVAVYTGRMGDATLGPVATHMLVVVPVIALGVAIQTPGQDDTAAPQQLITLPIAQTTVMTLQDLWPAVPFVKELPDTQIFLQTGALVLVIWAVMPLLSSPAPALQSTPPSPPQMAQESSQTNFARLILIPILLFLTSTILQSPTLPQPPLEPYIHPTYPLRILSSVRSPHSGVVVVGEALPPSEDKPIQGDLHSLRYLRAGHSLVGGAWIGDMAELGREPGGELAHDEAGEPLGNSIYDAFVLQEAARLVEKPGGGERKNALVIGLGAGTAVSALMRHNVSTTIVEIDGNIYDAARQFFALPEPNIEKVVIRDARAWTRERRRALEQTAEAGLFDIVVHDVFSGGGLPPHLFTQQFWNDTKALMQSDGVLAVNFAGRLNSDSSRAIILTLESVFKSCRAFCDVADPGGNVQDVYHNWVLFCTPSTEPLKFRDSVDADYLGSTQRRRVLAHLSEREFDVDYVRNSITDARKEQYILMDAKNPLDKWQQKEALDHWGIMRQVLPDVFWETY
ncbi:spermidine synthase [Wolfiporia cocos MD-104 SS10]|uniref:Spermidine synthase n=1 Tax=Wolfiporia cocos (strain MD-104) TaxID=742152 RepID=A0A2H3JI06_WOLCO|nr:spermidine synthase [Wolfiporia cocos MD-104 SS10]